MTTAHRPTWHTAKGGTEQGGNVLINPSRGYSAKDLPAHKTLKERHDIQHDDKRQRGGQTQKTVDEFRQELLEKEREKSGVNLNSLEGGQTRQNDPNLPQQMNMVVGQKRQHTEQNSTALLMADLNSENGSAKSLDQEERDAESDE